MLRFEWSAFVTPALLQQIADASGASLQEVQGMAPRLARLFEHVGGLPFVTEEPSLETRTAVGLQWLDEAMGHALAEVGLRSPMSGLVPAEDVDANSLCAAFFEARTLVDANHAGIDEWHRLPEVSAALARIIVEERDAHGAYKDLKDFEKRVDGIGPVRAKRLEDVLYFSAPVLPRIDAVGHQDWAGRLRTLLYLQPQADPPAVLLAGVLNQLLSSVARCPHPASEEALLRDIAAVPGGANATNSTSLAAPVDADWVGELWGSSYWSTLPGLMESAKQSIELCMFHVAAPNPKHPTYPLMQGLVDAHQRGVTVRAIVDRDRKNDPYLSTLINSAARRFLSEAGIDCRSDSSNQLLHSKYLVFDRKLVVLGSHNWSSGSYFKFDDLSLVVHSPSFATQLLERFESLWKTAH